MLPRQIPKPHRNVKLYRRITQIFKILLNRIYELLNSHNMITSFELPLIWTSQYDFNKYSRLVYVTNRYTKFLDNIQHSYALCISEILHNFTNQLPIARHNTRHGFLNLEVINHGINIEGTMKTMVIDTINRDRRWKHVSAV